MRVRMVLFEKSLPFQLTEEDLKNPSASLLSVNPNGSVPVLRHNGQVILESAIITEYLEEIAPTPPLMPQDPWGRAQVRLWTSWCDNVLKPDLDQFKYELRDLSASDRDELIARLQSHIEKLGAGLKHSDYLVGNSFTLSDIHVFPFFRQLSRANPEFDRLINRPDDLARAHNWLTRMTSRPSFEKTMENSK